MSEKKRGRTRPARWLGVPAVLCAMMLTACLFLGLVSLLAAQVMTSPAMHERAATAEDVMDLQMARIQEELTELAEEYGFDPADLTELVSRDAVKELNRKIVRWWTGSLAEGELLESPSFNLEGVEEALSQDEAFISRVDDVVLHLTLEGIRNKASDIVRKSGLQFRELIVNLGGRMAAERADLPEIMGLMKQAAPLMLLTALLLSGLIALLLSRDIRSSFLYIGGSLSGSGLLMILCWTLLKLMDFRRMVAEASAALVMQVSNLGNMITLEMLGTAAALLALGGLLMAWSSRGTKV